MKNFNWPKSLFVTIFTFCILHSASANTITVSSVAELQSAIAKAKPGDKIVVQDGVYTTSSDINITCVGTKRHPVTITAQDFGKVEVTGAGGFNLVSPSVYVIIRDFKFTHAAS